MKKLRGIGITLSAVAVASAAVGVTSSTASREALPHSESREIPAYRVDTIIMPWGEVRVDTILLSDTETHRTAYSSWRTEAEHIAHIDSASRYLTLTEADYRVVASELEVETAAIKAVVRVEAGAALEGFWAPGVPVINFDNAMYRRMKPACNKKSPSDASVPAGITSAYGRKEWSQLIAARKVNEDKANMGTFWGMFQIGGFNYKLCGCKDVDEFVERMSFSEFEQLELFGIFIRNTGMLPALQSKNWAAFARKYNGASYARRGYHTKMANAYARFKKEEAEKATPAAENPADNSSNAR